MSKSNSAEKRHKQSLKNKTRNRHIRSTVKTAVKEARAAVSDKNAAETLSKASSVIAKAGSKGVLHKKTVARKVARLSKAIHKAAAGK